MLGLSLPAIIKTVSMVGAQAPAFIELFQQVKGAFSEEDQQKLQSAYDEARAKSDDAQADFDNAKKGN